MITAPAAVAKPTSQSLTKTLLRVAGFAALATVSLFAATRHDLLPETTGFRSCPVEKFNLGNLGLCRAEWASCHVWDCCESAGDGKPMWCNPQSGGAVAGVGKARCVVCENGIETGNGDGSGEVCDVTQKNAYGKDGVDEVAAEAAKVAMNLEAGRVKGSIQAPPPARGNIPVD